MDDHATDQAVERTDEITLSDIVLFLWDRKYAIIAITVLCAAAGVVRALIAPVKYQSVSRLITKSGSNNKSELAQMAALAGYSVGGGGSTDLSEYLPEVIKDREFLLKILNRKWRFGDDSLLLEQVWEMEPDTTGEDWRHVYESRKVQALRGGDYVSLSKDAKTGLFTLKTLFSGPDLAFQINAYVLELLDQYVRSSLKSQAKEKREFIEKRLEEVKHDLAVAENVLANFKERNVGSVAPKVMVEEQRLQRKVMINQEVYLELQKQYEAARIQEKNDQPLIEVITRPEIPVDRASPKRRLIVMLSTLLGVFGGILLIFIHNFIQHLRKTRTEHPSTGTGSR